jgi:hypothetical protein
MPAILFELWNAHIDENGALTFEVTQADTFRLDRGSRRFMDSALAALGFELETYSWQVTPGRSFYYSDDPQEKDWRHRWPLAWQVRVTPQPPLTPQKHELFETGFPQGESDSTWVDSEDVELADEERYLHTVFLVVDFQISREEVETLVHSSWARTGLPPLPELEIRELAHELRQLYLVVSGVDLPGDVPALEQFLASMRAAGAAINWRWRTWRTTPEPPLKPEMIEWMTKLGYPPKTS